MRVSFITFLVLVALTIVGAGTATAIFLSGQKFSEKCKHYDEMLRLRVFERCLAIAQKDKLGEEYITKMSPAIIIGKRRFRISDWQDMSKGQLMHRAKFWPDEKEPGLSPLSCESVFDQPNRVKALEIGEVLVTDGRQVGFTGKLVSVTDDAIILKDCRYFSVST